MCIHVVPECGVEHMIDISKFANEDFDIESTRVYCEKCSVNLRNNTERRNIKCPVKCNANT